jgi:hypothetical protein
VGLPLTRVCPTIIGAAEALIPLCWDHNLVLCELRNSTSNLINHQDINHTQEHEYLHGKPFLLEGKTTGQTPNKSTIIILNYNSSPQVMPNLRYSPNTIIFL